MPSTARGPFLNSRTRPSTSMPLSCVIAANRSEIFDGVKYELMLHSRRATISRRGSVGPVLAHLQRRKAAPHGADDRARTLVPAVDGPDAPRARRAHAHE